LLELFVMEDIIEKVNQLDMEDEEDEDEEEEEE
jgi:hypothetical protein